MSLYDNNLIEFKLTLNSPMATCYYIEKYNLETIVEISLIYNKKYNKDIEAVYQYYRDKILIREMNIILSEDKNIMSLMYQKNVDDDVIDVELKLKKIIFKKDDINQALMKEVEQLKKICQKNEKIINELKKNNDLLMEEYNKIKEKEKEEEKRKIEEEKEKEKRIIEEKKEEEKRKIEEEKLLSLNDNVNYINNFKFDNFQELKNIDSISYNNCNYKCVAVYCIIKNNERLYQMAYPKYKNSTSTSHIIIYNLILNKVENKINQAHSGNINNLKHYFHSSTKNHILLSSSKVQSKYSNNSISLWNISSNPIINILQISDCYRPCIMFKNEDFFIFGGNNENKSMSVWNKNGNLIKTINKSNFKQNLDFIKATYLEKKSYILLSGYNYNQTIGKNLYYSECYNYDEDDIKTYKDDDNNSQIYCINLFKKGNDIYLITGFKEKINIFEFYTTKLIKRIQLGSNIVYSLCSINEKYIIASNSYKLKIIDMENYSVIKEYSAHYDGQEYDIYGIEKIKIPEKGELIITYSSYCIKIWKI